MLGRRADSLTVSQKTVIASVYTLNYEVLQLPGGAPAPLTEPSVSLWTPCDAGQTC